MTLIEKGGEVKYIEAQFDPTYDAEHGTISDASKLMGGNRHGNASEQRVTLDLADDYYKIASESKYNGFKEETGKDLITHEGVKQWYYFINDIYFAEYESEDLVPYTVSINVKEKSDGHFFYSFSAEKTEGTSTPQTLHAAVSDNANVTTDESSFTHSIRNPDGIVKENNSADPDSTAKSSTRKGESGKILAVAQQENLMDGLNSSERSVLEAFNRTQEELKAQAAEKAKQEKILSDLKKEGKERSAEASKAKSRIGILQKQMERTTQKLIDYEDMASVKAVVEKVRPAVEKFRKRAGSSPNETKPLFC